LAEDFNRDGTPDTYFYYSNGIIAKAERDRNSDGVFDYLQWYTDGIESRFEAVDNFDGVIDVRGTCQNGDVATSFADTDFNGIPDVTFAYSNGVLAAATWQPNGSTNVLRLETFRHGVKAEELLDTDGNGMFDRRLLFDPFGNILLQENVRR